VYDRNAQIAVIGRGGGDRFNSMQTSLGSLNFGYLS
jgi:hypothetical protein